MYVRTQDRLATLLRLLRQDTNPLEKSEEDVSTMEYLLAELDSTALKDTEQLAHHKDLFESFGSVDSQLANRLRTALGIMIDTQQGIFRSNPTDRSGLGET